jgi:hypothetical protein
MSTRSDGGHLGAEITRSDALYRDLRWQLPICSVFILVALIILALTSNNAWSWPLFAWGLAVGAGGAAITQLMLRVLGRQPEVAAHDRDRVESRRPIYLALWLGGGAIIGALASIFGTGWIDVIGAVYSALSILAGLALFFVARQRIRAKTRMD